MVRSSDAGRVRPASTGRWFVTRKRKSRRGGSRPGAGRPAAAGVARSVHRGPVRLTPGESAAHDAARGTTPWGEWIRGAAEAAIRLAGIRAQAAVDGCTATVLYCDVITGRPLDETTLDHLQPEAAARISSMTPTDALREIGLMTNPLAHV